MSRADKRTRTSALTELFSDFDLSFARNPVTDSLARVVNDDAVKSSIRNLILASRGEWAYHPTLGSRIYHLLFEPLDDVTSSSMVDVIYAALQYESRADVQSVQVVPNLDRDGYDITIVFMTLNSVVPVVFTEFLYRVR